MCNGNCNCGAAAANTTNTLLAEVVLALRDIALSLSDIADAVMAADDGADAGDEQVAGPDDATVGEVLAALSGAWGRVGGPNPHTHTTANPAHNHGVSEAARGRYLGLAR